MNLASHQRKVLLMMSFSLIYSQNLLELERTLLNLSFRVMPFDRFVNAIDQNILKLTEEFVSRVILG